MKKNFLAKYTFNDNSYKIIENSFSESDQRVQETLFTIGNGFIGSRGIMEENPLYSCPGTFISGMYGISAAQVEELINLPNPINCVVAVDGEKFDIFTMKVLSHRRVLDMKNGVLVRKTLFQDAKKRKYIYQSVRFFSMDDPHIGAMKISIKLLKGTANIAAMSRIDDSVYNSGGLMLSRRRHFNTVKADKEEYFDYTAFRTNFYKDIIAYGDAFIIDYEGRSFPIIDRFFQFDLRTGQEIIFTKIFSIYTSRKYSAKSIKRETMRALNDAVEKGFDRLFQEHIKKFNERWKNSDIVIKGDYDCQRAVRFNIYHMLISTREEYAIYSIAAKTLSGQGYRGHIFWDTEIYLLPFYIYTQPEIARNLLKFRFNTLPQAKNIAKEKGYEGAMYPWEATVSGTEQTPRYSKDVDGRIVEVKTHDFEHHITADVAYGVYNYYSVTGDKQFMIDYGAEILFETARFWASRVSYNKKDKKYHINGIIGPDEFHVNVNDNAYTNYLAKWNLKSGVEIYNELKNGEKIKKTLKKIKLALKEIEKWKDIAESIVILKSKKHKIINQFDGYLRKKDYTVKGYDKNFMPLTPKYFEYAGLDKTRLIKQADVLLLFHLFGEEFTKDEKISNYNYYIMRTIHKSSLSYCMHSIVSACLEDYFRSFCFFWMAVNIDLMDIPNNTADGIHAANLGGVWQALIFGYGGVSCSGGEVKITSKLPKNFKSLKFKFFNRGDLFEVEESDTQVKLRFLPENNKSDKRRLVKVYGEEVMLTPHRYKTIKSREVYKEMITVKDVIKKENLVTVGENTTVRKIGKLLLEKKISSVVVVDRDKNLKGIISEINVIKSTFDEKAGELKASRIMETKVIFVNGNDSLEKITKVFTKYPYRRLPVLKGNKVIGVITRRDIIADFLGGYY